MYQELLPLREQYQLEVEREFTRPWIRIVEVHPSQTLSNLQAELDPGEAAAIALAMELRPKYLIIDERDGTRVAKSHQLNTIGLLGILLLAKAQQQISAVHPYLDRLMQEADFFISSRVYRRVLELAEEI